MNTDEDNTKVSIADETVTSEMDVELTPISQVGEASTTENVGTETVTSISLHENKTDEMLTRLCNMMCSNFNYMNFKFEVQNKKLDEQKSDSNIKYTNLNNKFDEQRNEIRNSFDIKCNELKNEIKIRNDNLIRQCDKVIKKLDESLIQIENQKVSSSEHSKKNEVLINKVNNSDNVNNEFTDSKNIILENDNESIMSGNEVFECTESEREFGESIFVQGEQGLEFSFDVVLGGEEES